MTLAAAFRKAAPSDEPLLWGKLYLFIPPGGDPLSRTALSQPELARYVRGWGRPGDLARSRSQNRTDASGNAGRSFRLSILMLSAATLMLAMPRYYRLTTRGNLLARFDGNSGLGQWRINEGTYQVALGKSAGELVLKADAPLTPRVFGQ